MQNVSAESFDQFDIDMDVKGWHKLPGLESKVMYMVEDLPEEEGDANEEPSREVGQPQEISFLFLIITFITFLYFIRF